MNRELSITAIDGKLLSKLVLWMLNKTNGSLMYSKIALLAFNWKIFVIMLL